MKLLELYIFEKRSDYAHEVHASDISLKKMEKLVDKYIPDNEFPDGVVKGEFVTMLAEGLDAYLASKDYYGFNSNLDDMYRPWLINKDDELKWHNLKPKYAATLLMMDFEKENHMQGFVRDNYDIVNELGKEFGRKR